MVKKMNENIFDKEKQEKIKEYYEQGIIYYEEIEENKQERD